jgi:8-oxo-dGTP diphosphatase
MTPVPETRKLTEVAAAVIERPDGTFLLAQRPEGKPYPGYWEFPGGKIEPGEDARAALVRELREELGIEVRAATPWITRVYAYTHATVRLHFFRVTAWEGEPRPLEDQDIKWQRVEAPDVSPMLPANAPVLAALALPAVMVVSNASDVGVDAWVRALHGRLPRERMLIQLREKSLGRDVVQDLASRVIPLARSHGMRVVVNSAHGPVSGAGVHLASGDLLAATSRPDAPLAGASCHDERELMQAAKLDLDYAVVGPVDATASHPGATPIGWDRAARLIATFPLPVYLIGGLTRVDLPRAREAGAHGVALRSAALSDQ